MSDERLYTQADLDAAVQAEREACATQLDMMRKAHNDALIGQPHTPDTSIAYGNGAAAIRARGPTDALAAALAQAEQRGGEIVKARFIAETRKHMEGLLAQARQETWEKAAVIAETLRDGNPSAIAGTAWWGTKIAAAIRLAAAQEGA